MAAKDFDIDELLREPLVACIATTGPTVRPVWFLWEEGMLWWLTGPWSALGSHLQADPQVAASIDECELATGTLRQVLMRGRAEIVEYDRDRAYRTLARYLGPDADRWPDDFGVDDGDQYGNQFVRLTPQWIHAADLSFTWPA